MNELTRLSQLIVEETPLPRTGLDELRRRSHLRRHVKRRVLTTCTDGFSHCGGVQRGADPSDSDLNAEAPLLAQLASYYQAAINVPISTLEAVGLPSSVSIPK